MRPVKYLIAALALALSSGLAAEANATGPSAPGAAAGQSAGQRANKARPSFEQLDKNRDGKILAGEVPARGWQRLSRADSNHDSAVTKAEFDAVVARRGARATAARQNGKSFELLDKNHDGKLVASEVPTRRWQRLSGADANHDSAVDKAEFDAAVARRGQGATAAGKNARTFEQLDKNHDGKIVASEVPPRGWQRLSRADTNRDNAVTQAELAAMRAGATRGRQ